MKKAGFTILELLVSIVILSVVLTFAMNLFLKIRSAYTHEKSDIELEITRSIIIDSVMSDIIDLGVKSVTCNQNKMTIRFKGDETLVKYLTFDKTNADNDYIKYNQRGAAEIVRKLPKDSLIGNLDCTKQIETVISPAIGDATIINHIYYNITDENGNDYSIDLQFYSIN